MNQAIFSKKIKKDDNESLLSWRKKLLLRTTHKRLKKKYSDKQSDMLSLLSAIELELNKRSLKKQNYAVAEGLMSYHGYRVGETNGVSDEVRQEILRRIFTGPVMPVIGKWYMSEWGEDKSLERLNKIESNLWGFILDKSHKDHLRALAEWEADLAWIQDSKKLWLQEIA